MSPRRTSARTVVSHQQHEAEIELCNAFTLLSTTAHHAAIAALTGSDRTILEAATKGMRDQLRRIDRLIEAKP